MCLTVRAKCHKAVSTAASPLRWTLLAVDTALWHLALTVRHNRVLCYLEAPIPCFCFLGGDINPRYKLSINQTSTRTHTNNRTLNTTYTCVDTVLGNPVQFCDCLRVTCSSHPEGHKSGPQKRIKKEQITYANTSLVNSVTSFKHSDDKMFNFVLGITGLICLMDNLMGVSETLCMCLFMHIYRYLMVVPRTVSKICLSLKKYWPMILPWTIHIKNVFILEGNKNGNQRRTNKTKHSRTNTSDTITKTRYLQRKAGTQRIFKEGHQPAKCCHVTTSTIKINKRAILVALLIISAHVINSKMHHLDSLAQVTSHTHSHHKRNAPHIQHNDTSPNLLGPSHVLLLQATAPLP